MTSTGKMGTEGETRNGSRDGGPLLEVRGLITAFDTDRGLQRAVDEVSLSVDRGRTLGVVGVIAAGGFGYYGLWADGTVLSDHYAVMTELAPRASQPQQPIAAPEPAEHAELAGAGLADVGTERPETPAPRRIPVAQA